MKRIFLCIFMLCLMVSCGAKNDSIEQKDVSSSENNQEKIEKTVEDLTEGELQEARGRISLDDLDLLIGGIESGNKDTDSSLGEKENKDESYKNKDLLLQEGKNFLTNIVKTQEIKLTESYEGGILYNDFQNEIAKVHKRKKIHMKLKIIDVDDTQVVQSGNVYVNNINMGTFKQGVFDKEFEWPIGIERFNIVIRSKYYGDAFMKLNSINTDSKAVRATIKMKKAKIKKNVNLTNEYIYQGKDISIKLLPCSLIDSLGKCVKKADMKINFISGTDVNSNNVSVSMKALTNEGELITLASGGMAFVDFMSPEGEIYKLRDDHTITYTYKITDKDIQNMNGLQNQGYWWYDKVKGLWFQGTQEFILDEKNKTWSTTTRYLY